MKERKRKSKKEMQLWKKRGKRETEKRKANKALTKWREERKHK
jgi:hypothetical protein